MASTAEEITGRVVIVAHLQAKPGKGDEVAQVISEVRDFALSDGEPGTHAYRLTRFGETFAFFEEYENAAATHEHLKVGLLAPKLLSRKDELIETLEWKYYKEF